LGGREGKRRKMSLNLLQFKDLIERKITEINMYSPAAVNQLLGTAAVESDFGTYLRQRNGGPGRGVFSMEPATEKDIWENYLDRNDHEDLARDVCMVSGVCGYDPDALEYNLAYQIVMARIHYWRVEEPLPEPSDIEGLARYWKQYYNTHAGKGTVKQFLTKYRKYVGFV
jgi:hypothetical protein